LLKRLFVLSFLTGINNYFYIIRNCFVFFISHTEESRFPSRRFTPQDDAGRLEV